MSVYSNNPSTILKWAKEAKGIYIPMPGTGGGVVQVKKSDFIYTLNLCIKEGNHKLDCDYSLHNNGYIYG